MLASDVMRVALATTHLPLRAVAAHLTQTLLERRLRILHGAMRAQFGLPNPRILVCGLNPHAGESGHLGREEINVIAPVCERHAPQVGRYGGRYRQIRCSRRSISIMRMQFCDVSRSRLAGAEILWFWQRGEHFAGPTLYSHFSPSVPRWICGYG